MPINEVDRLSVGIEARLDRFEREMRRVEGRVSTASRTMTRSMDGFTGSVKRARVALATIAVPVIAAGTAAGVAAARMLQFASDVEETANKAAVVFGENIGRVRDNLQELSDTTGRSRFRLLELAAGMQDILVPLGFTRRAATDASLALTKLGVDVSSFQNASEVDVLRAFQSTLVGNTDAARSYGISITAADVKNEAYAAGLVNVGEELTKTARAQATINLLFRNSEDALDDAAETARTYAGQTRRLRAEFGELVIALTGPNTTNAADAVGAIADSIATIADNVTALQGNPAWKAFIRTIAFVARYSNELNPVYQAGRVGNAVAGLFEGPGEFEGGLDAAERRSVAPPLTAAGRRIARSGQGNAGDTGGGTPQVEATALPVPQNTFRDYIAQGLDRAGEQSSAAELERVALATEHAEETLRIYEQTMLDAQRATEEFDARMGQLAGTIANQLVSAVRQGELSLNTLADIGKNVVASLIQEFLKLQVIQPLLSGIFSGGAPGVPGLGEGSLDAAVDAFRAEGGPVNARRPYLVGERGPEIFVPSSAGSILANGRGAGGGMQLVVQQTLNIQTGVAETVQAEMIGLLPQFEESARNGILAEVERGGSFAAQLRGGR